MTVQFEACVTLKLIGLKTVAQPTINFKIGVKSVTVSVSMIPS